MSPCRSSSCSPRSTGAVNDAALHDFALLAGYDGLIAGYTSRENGVSEAPYDSLNLGFHVGDRPEAVLANRERLAGALGVDLANLIVARQVHGSHVRTVSAADRGCGAYGDEAAIPDTDALITRHPGIVLAVMAADCVPIVVFDPDTRAIGVVHAGWKGTVAHVARTAVETMAREFDSDPVRFVAAIGPSIGPESYEVGDEVAEQARAAFPEANVIDESSDGKLRFDLWQSNAADLVAAGLRRENVEVAGIDTFTDERFFSHRRQAPTGRFMAYAALGTDVFE